MDLLLFFLFYALFFFASFTKVSASPRKERRGPIFDVSPPRGRFSAAASEDQLNDQPPLIDLPKEGPSSSKRQSKHRRGSSALPFFAVACFPFLAQSSDTNRHASPPIVPRQFMAPMDGDISGINNQPSPPKHRRHRSDTSLFASSTQTNDHSQHKQNVNVAKTRRTRRPSISQSDAIAKQLNALAIQERIYNQTPTQYPKLPINKWTNLRLPVHSDQLRAGGKFDVKEKCPEATNEFDKIVEFMDDTGKWVKIEIKQGKGVVIYLRDLLGNPLQFDEPMNLSFGGKKRFLRTNGAEILYPTEIIYSWMKFQLPVHAEHLEIGGQFDVKEKCPEGANEFDKIVEFMDDTGKWVKIEIKKREAGAKYARDLFGNPPQIEEPMELFFGGRRQFVSIDGTLMTESAFKFLMEEKKKLKQKQITKQWKQKRNDDNASKE
ncbi:hypothetical protein niasHT_030009 [Heterodera trifolii]|uniref:Uncharacterized protein n=1 Tax=Heterodera trifolii TaxID=157864 RepID=A0ABD2JJP3_9BILA